LDRFPGATSISQEALYRLYRDVFSEAARNGVRHLVAVNGRGGNVHALRMAARDVSKATGLAMVVANCWADLAKEVRRRVLKTPEGHAAEDETSEAVAAYPHLVRRCRRTQMSGLRPGTRYTAGKCTASPTERRCSAPRQRGKRARPYLVGRGGARRADKGAEGGGVAPPEA